MSIESSWQDPLAGPTKNYAQSRFLHSTAPWNYLIGGRGVGKTAALVMRNMLFSIESPGLRSVITEQTNKDIADVLIPCWRALIPDRLFRWKKEDGGWNAEWHNGSITTFRTRQARNTMADPPFHGMTVGAVQHDELSLDKRTDVLAVSGMMVRQEGVKRLIIDIACTPRRNWLYGHMLSKGLATPGDAVQQSDDGSSVAYYGATQDNVHNRDLHGRMIGEISEREARQYLYGEWVEEEGRVWTGFVESPWPAGNLIDYEFNPRAGYILAVDHGGSDGYWGVWQPVTGHGGGFSDSLLVLCAEYTPQGRPAYQIIQEVKDKYGTPARIFTGHDHVTRGNAGDSAHQLFTSHGWGHAERVLGDLMNKETHGNQLAMMICNTAGERRLAISNTCEHHYPGASRSAKEMFLHDTWPDPGSTDHFRKEKSKNVYFEDSRDAALYMAVSLHPQSWGRATKWAA